MGLIAGSVLALVLASFASLAVRWRSAFLAFEVFAVGVFTLEYIGRIWAAPEDERFSGRFTGRLRYACRPMMLIDLAAILPFYLAGIPADLRFLRSFRLMRVFRIARMARYSSAMSTLGEAVARRREELTVAISGMGILILIAASALYSVEHVHQPENFSSIPATMWWAVATLTTVGYGDVYPITALGKLLGAVTAVLGIAMFAVPTGILGAAFSEAMQQREQSPPAEGV